MRTSLPAQIVADYLHISHADRTLAVLPFSFDAGLNQLITAFHTGATCVLIKFLFAKEIVAALAKERITGLAGVPSLWNLLAQENSRLHETPLEHLKYITNTGGALPLSVLAKLREALPQTDVVLMYGLTEAFRSTYLPPDELERRPTSIGKAIPNSEIFVVNEAGQLCGPGEIGELVHRGPTVSLGYWGHPTLTAQVLRPNPFAPPQHSQPEMVCYSGDLVITDDDGFLYFVGRRDNQIKSAGFRISPNEVEAALCRAATVREAAVIGLPDEVLGEQIKAFVVPQDGARVNVDAILEDVAEHLPRHMVPREVEVLDELPKTSSGKIDYPNASPPRNRTSNAMTPPHELSEPKPTSRDLVAEVIARHFGVTSGELTVGDKKIGDIATEFGTPLFVYDRATLERQWQALRDALPAAVRYLLLGESQSESSAAAILRRAWLWVGDCLQRRACPIAGRGLPGRANLVRGTRQDR